MDNPVQFLVMPVTVMEAGKTYGPQVSAEVSAAYPKYQLAVEKLDDWPDGECLRVLVEYSQDAGLTWRDDAAVTFAGGPWRDKAGNVVTAGGLNVHMGTLAPGSEQQQILATLETDLFRVTAICLQSCAALITMSGVP